MNPRDFRDITEAYYSVYNLNEKFNERGEFIRDGGDVESKKDESPEEKDRRRVAHRVRTGIRPAMTYAERERKEASKTPEQKEEERQRRMRLSQSFLNQQESYEIISYLLEEGYAETIEEAEEIFVNLDEASRNTLSKAAGKLAMGAAKVGAKLAWKGTKAALRAVRDYGEKYPVDSKRRAVADTLSAIRWATLSDKERRKRINAKHRARNTKKGHEEIMRRNKESERIRRNRIHARRDTARGHEEIMRNNREYQTAGKSSGGYRNIGVGRRERIREELDIYDIILFHLLDEGYVDTIESAEAIMVNMSEEWRDSIIG